MKPRFAFMSEAPADAVSEFLQSVGLSRDIIEWKYFDARFNRSQGERGVVILRGTSVAGMLGFTRIAYGAPAARWTGYWIYDWAKNNDAGRGAGRRLVLECARRCGIIIGVGGTVITRHIFPSIATMMVPGAYVGLQKPLRLGFVMDRLPVRRLPERARRAVRRAVDPVPLAPLFGRRLEGKARRGAAARVPAATIRTEAGVPRAIEPLLQPWPGQRPGPLHDFEYIDWQLGRCPVIDAATTYFHDPAGPRAAVLHWRSSSAGTAGRYWRMALLCQPHAGDELAALVDYVVALAYQRGAVALSAVASRHDRTIIEQLRARGFLLGRSRMPMWLFRGQGERAPLIELAGTSYLDADLAYRF